MKNKTFSEQAEKVDRCLQAFRDAQKDVEDAKYNLDSARVAAGAAGGRLEAAKRELFEAHPELAPESTPRGDNSMVEVDDPDVIPDFRESVVG